MQDLNFWFFPPPLGLTTSSRHTREFFAANVCFDSVFHDSNHVYRNSGTRQRLHIQPPVTTNRRRSTTLNRESGNPNHPFLTMMTFPQ